MNKNYFLTASMMVLMALGCDANTLKAQKQVSNEQDSMQLIQLQEVQVIGVRATKTNPVTKSELTKKQIEANHTGVDIPYLLTLTPGVVATSDAGTGVGYTSMRLRGSDASRINFTINGVPLSDPESQQVFWVNMPDFASSLQSIQVQRGVGTSSNGAGAFGGSVNMLTESFGSESSGTFNLDVGSYQHVRSNIKYNTGTINDHFAFGARLSTQHNTGYIDRSGVDLNSYFLQGGYFSDRSMLKFITFGGKEITGIAWNGISPDEIEKYGRRYNSAGLMYRDEQGVAHYTRNTDNYSQRHYQLIFTHNFNAYWSMSLTGHLTRGFGYTQEYRTGRKLLEYNLQPYKDNNGNKIKKRDLTREKYLDNYFYGFVGNLNWQQSNLKLNMGVSANKYDNKHYGYITAIKDYPQPLTLPYEYYRNQSHKTEASAFVKMDWRIWKGLGTYADLQYRWIKQQMNGPTDKYDGTNKRMQILDFEKNFGFFNPKFGIYYNVNSNHYFYASAAMAGREPNRKAYTEAGNLPEPKAEYMWDYEAGYKMQFKSLAASLNVYYMDYKDQLVLDGRVSDVGEALVSNVNSSYRAGIELALSYQPCEFFKWDIAAAYSKNKIREYEQYADVYGPGDNDYAVDKRVYKNTDLSFSPSLVATNIFTLSYKNLSLAWTSQYVGKQYLDNTQNEARSMPDYLIHNARINYELKGLGLKNMIIGLEVRNILNKDYYSNAGAGFAYTKDNAGKLTESTWSWIYPQAPINFMANLNITF